MGNQSRVVRLQDKVAIVTGGAHGVGKHYCLRLAAEEAKIAIADLDQPAAEAVVESIEARGGQALAVKADVSDPESAEEMARKVRERFGRIDILVNNAAIFSVSPISRKPFWELTLEEWDRVLAVNLTGAFLCCKAVFPYMKAQGGGKIINISSAVFFIGVGNYVHYVASRAGMIGLTRGMAREVGQFNINVNCVAPGSTLSEEDPTEAVMDMRKLALPNRSIQRIQYPEDLVGTVAFLASNDSDFITGQTIVVDGGHIMH